MSTAIATTNGKDIADQSSSVSYETMQSLIVGGDLSRLSPQQMVEYYTGFCSRIGLDPVTQPFKVLVLNGKKTLYCDRGGTAQLNKKHGVTHTITGREKSDDLYIVTVKASLQDGRATESIGAVSIINLKGENLANAMMKAETKAKRRSTLDLVGLGILDESELESILGAQTQPIQTTPTVIEPEAKCQDQEQSQSFKQLPQITDQERTERRKWRASVNKAGTNAKTMEDVSKCITYFTEKLGAMFDSPTYHNETETYRSLLAVHADRIEEDEKRKSPEGVKQWVELMRNSDAKEFESFVKVYNRCEHLQTVEVEQELQDHATDLGFTHYSEVTGEQK